MKKQLLILGAGAAGTMSANMLRRKLKKSEWDITVIDKDDQHIYQPGLLFVPFGMYTPEEIVRSRGKCLAPDIKYVIDEIESLDTEKQVVKTTSHTFEYDKIIVATGARIVPEEIDGMMEGWRKNIFDFYTMEGATALAEALRNFKGGKLILNIAELPYKCPVAPLEFVYLADHYFHERGIREKVDIQLVTPLPSAFTKPKATAHFSAIAKAKDIEVVGNFELIEVDYASGTIISADDKKMDYDLLVSIPPHAGAGFLAQSGAAMDETGYMATNKHTLQSMSHPNMYVVGDGSNIPTSKAGSVAHFSAEVMVENFMRELAGEPVKPDYDGHSNCFIETGFGKASLIDFNYTVEPLPGMFPLPGMGPFTLLGESKANHWGKMLFKWVYWNQLMPGGEFPLEAQMSMAGKLH